MPERNSLLYYRAEEYDQLISKLFRLTRESGPESRHLLFVLLLRYPNSVCPGYDYNTILSNVLATIQNEQSKQEIINILGVLSQMIDTDIPVDYFCASYWSPDDQRRHTVFHKMVRSDCSLLESLVYAYAFFAVTFFGESLNDKLLSVVHYIATRSPDKHGLTTVFSSDDLLSDSVHELNIPVGVSDGAIRQMGLQNAIDRQIISCFKDNPNAVTDLLKVILHNCDSELNKIINDIASPIVDAFLEHVDGFINANIEFMQYAQQLLKTFFDDNSLTLKQVAFMVATQLIWRRACPCKLMYTFVTVVEHTSCILTCGVQEPLNEKQRLLIRTLSNSIFNHALLLDYSAHAAHTEGVQRNYAFRRFLGHNLPKILIKPASIELITLNRSADELDSPIKDAITESINRLNGLFAHFETLLIALSPSDSPEGLLDMKLSQIEFDADIRKFLLSSFEYLRRLPLDNNTRQKLELRIAPQPHIVFCGHKNVLIEVLYNLVSNAASAIDPYKVQNNPANAAVYFDAFQIDTSESPIGAHVQFTITDHGVGITPDKLMQLQEINKQLKATTRNKFYQVLNELLDRSMIYSAREERMGIGLIFALAYLRSLEWHEDIGRIGILEMQRNQGSNVGTTAILKVPIPSRTGVVSAAKFLNHEG